MKKIFNRIFAPALILLLPLISLAQNRTLSGVVINEKGDPVSNASVLLRGTTRGTTTNEKGEFSLTVPTATGNSSRTLTISSLGYLSKDVPVTEGAYSDRADLLRPPVSTM